MNCENFPNFARFSKDQYRVIFVKNKLCQIVVLMPMCVGVIALSGCVTAPATVAVAPVATPIIAPAKPTVLTTEADNALKAAEQTIIETRVRRALWSAATEQLDRARAAAKTFDSDLTLKHAREAIALCQLSLQQKKSPPVTW